MSHNLLRFRKILPTRETRMRWGAYGGAAGTIIGAGGALAVGDTSVLWPICGAAIYTVMLEEPIIPLTLASVATSIKIVGL